MRLDRLRAGKQEKIAWLGLLVFGSGMLYVTWMLFIAQPDVTSDQAAFAKVPYRFFLLFMLSYGLLLWRDKSILADERDRQIGAKRQRVALMSLASLLVLTAAAVGVDGVWERIVVKPPEWVEGFIVLQLLIALTAQALVGVWCYLRDRR